MKLSTKLIGSFLIVVLFIGGIGLVSSYLNDVVKDQVTVESNETIKEVTLAGELGLQLFKSITRTQYLLEDSYRQNISMDYGRTNKDIEVQRKAINRSLIQFEENFKQLSKLLKSDTSKAGRDSAAKKDLAEPLEKLERKYQNYAALLKEFQEIEPENYQDRKEFFTATIEPYFRTNLLPSIERLRDNIKQSHQQQLDALSSRLDRISYMLIAGTILTLLIAIILVFYIYRSIAIPISQIADAAEKFGRGDLQMRIDYDSNDELGQLSQTFDRMADNLGKTTVSRDYVDSIIEAMADLLIVTDEKFKIIRVNTSTLDTLESTEEELLGKSLEEIFTELPSDIYGHQENEGKHTYMGEIRGKNKNNIPVSISRGTIKKTADDIEGYVFVASDITMQKKAQQKITESLREKEVLLAEIHHRVKNNLAVISGLLQMQIWESDSENARAALQESHLRVQSIALVHEKLYQSDSFSYVKFDHYIEGLLDAIEQVYTTDYADINIQLDIRDITLNVNQAIPTALLINELVINAFKYAFDRGEDGTIDVLVEKLDSDIKVKVADNGKGFDTKEKDVASLGLDLVKTLAAQLDGELRYFNNNGAQIEVVFAAEELVE